MKTGKPPERCGLEIYQITNLPNYQISEAAG
jgi:hypothetical protein